MSPNVSSGSAAIMRRLIAGIAAGLVTLLGGCGDDGILARFLLKLGRIIVERRPDAVYERLFPYYVELCAGSQFHSKMTGAGGLAGHAVMYIKGACKDDDAPYPQLRRCRVAATRLSDPEHGAGISVGRWFKNVNWVAVPGYHLFFDGGLEPGERLTRTRFEAVEQEAIAKGIYHGVVFHRYPGAEGDGDLRDYLKRHAIATRLCAAIRAVGFLRPAAGDRTDAGRDHRVPQRQEPGICRG